MLIFFELIIVSKHDLSLWLSLRSWFCTCVAGEVQSFPVPRQVPRHGEKFLTIRTQAGAVQ